MKPEDIEEEKIG